MKRVQTMMILLCGLLMFSGMSYGKNFDLKIRTQGGLLVSSWGENSGFDDKYDSHDEMLASVFGVSLNWMFSNKFYLGLIFNPVVFFGEDSDKSESTTDKFTVSYQLMPTVGWKIAHFARFITMYAEVGVLVFNDVDVDDDKYREIHDQSVDVDISTLSSYSFALGLDFRILQWLSVYVEHRISNYDFNYKYAGSDGGVNRVYVITDFGVGFSF